MKRSTLLLSTGAGLAALALLGWAFAPRPVAVEIGRAERGRFESSIDEDARTRLRERYVVSAPLAGRLARITLREGDPVAAGAVVAVLMPALPPMIDERTRQGLRARVESAQALVLRAAARIDRAKLALEQARSEANRTEQLAAKGFVAPTKLETDRLGLEAARKEVEAAEQERHAAEHDLDQARAALGAASAGGPTRPFEVRAPAQGRVLRVMQASEGTVALGTPLLEIGDTRALEVVAELLTTDALRTQPGDRVVIDRWGGPQPLEGRVRRIEPAAFTKVSALGVEEQRVNVLIDLVTPHERWQALGDGFRVSVRVIVLSADDALRVPVSAVFPEARPADADPAPRWATFAVRDGVARRTPVEVGARNGVHAWVRAGLAPGDAVVLYPPAALRDGDRVRERPR
jgi:HlyD family secretion protein